MMLRFKRCLKHDIMDFEKRIEMIRKIELSNEDKIGWLESNDYE